MMAGSMAVVVALKAAGGLATLCQAASGGYLARPLADAGRRNVMIGRPQGAGRAFVPTPRASMPRAFLTARWSNLFLATDAVPPALLRPRLAPGLDLDTRDGQAFVSLVAFDFLDTRVLGVPWPGYRNFPELNLRFYVRHGGERGVMFIRE